MKATPALLCLSALALLALLAAPASAGAAETTILTGKVRTLVTRSEQVHFNGVVNEVLVAPGDYVKRGQPIMRYTLQDDARRNLQKEVTNGASTENQEAQILSLKRELAQTRAQHNRARSLAASGLGSMQTSERLDVDVQALEKRIALYEDMVAKSRGNFDVRLAELSDYFDTPIHERDTLPEFLYLKSPLDGYVLSISPSVNPGATFNAGSAPIAIGQMDPMLIQVPVYEAEISALKVGDKANVEIPSLNNRKYEATISEIAWISNESDVSQPSYFNVELTIPNPGLEVRPGFKAIVRFRVE